MKDKNIDICCIGAMHWDFIGRSRSNISRGEDVPGVIQRCVGGVAFNIAVTLSRLGAHCAIIGVVGNDAEGDELVEICLNFGLETKDVVRSTDIPTDSYICIEDTFGMVAAVAAGQALELYEREMLAALKNRILATDFSNASIIVADGNMTKDFHHDIAEDDKFKLADLRVVAASSGKAQHLEPYLLSNRGTLYLNLDEACILGKCAYRDSSEAATDLVEQGAKRVIVTNGEHPACDALLNGVLLGRPLKENARTVTGAGDAFVAAHIFSEANGISRENALSSALKMGSSHATGKPHIA